MVLVAASSPGRLADLLPLMVMILRKPWRARLRYTSEHTATSVSAVRLIVPGKARWCVESPYHSGGAHSVPVRRAASSASALHTNESTPSGPAGPCCSVAPIGNRTMLSWVRYSATSSHVSSWIHTDCGIML